MWSRLSRCGVEAPVGHAGDRAVVGEAGRRDLAEVGIGRVGRPGAHPVPERALLELLDLLGGLADAVGDRAELARQLGGEVVALGDVVDRLGPGGDRDHDRRRRRARRRRRRSPSARTCRRPSSATASTPPAPAAGRRDRGRAATRPRSAKSLFLVKSAGGHSGHGWTVNGPLTAVAGSPEAGAPTSIVVARPQAPGLQAARSWRRRAGSASRRRRRLVVAAARALDGAVHADDAADRRRDVGPQLLVVVDRVTDDRLPGAVDRGDVA